MLLWLYAYYRADFARNAEKEAEAFINDVKEEVQKTLEFILGRFLPSGPLRQLAVDKVGIKELAVLGPRVMQLIAPVCMAICILVHIVCCN